MNKKYLRFFIVFSVVFYILFTFYLVFTFSSAKEIKTKEVTKLAKEINIRINTAYSLNQSFAADDFKRYIKILLNKHSIMEGIIIDSGDDDLQFINLRNDKLLSESSLLEISKGRVPNLKTGNHFIKTTKYVFSGKNNKIFHITLIFNLLDRVTIFPIFKKSLIILLSYFVLALIFFLVLPSYSKSNVIQNEKPIKTEADLYNSVDKENISSEKASEESGKTEIIPQSKEVKPEVKPIINDIVQTKTEPQKQPLSGMYSDKSGLVWGNLLSEKLSAELKRATAFDQDSCLVMIRIKNLKDIVSYKNISDLLIDRFPYRDLAFETGEDSFCIIIPEHDINEGQNKINDFMKIFLKQYAETDFELFAGITSRNGRMINSEIMIKEAESALDQAEQEEKNTTIAFKADLTKYREWLSKKDQ